jgi:hypothetical protein
MHFANNKLVTLEFCRAMGFFYISLLVLAVFCLESEVPSFKNGTGQGTTNLAEMKAADPLKWNSWRKR